MWLSSLIADMGKAVADDPATARAVFAAMGTLIGVAEADARAQAVSVKGEEPPAPGGSRAETARRAAGVHGGGLKPG